MRTIAKFFIGSMIAVQLLVAGCSKKPPITTMDFTQGDCVGMVKDAAGAPIPGASIMLVPENYSPLSPTAESGGNDCIDSTISDEYGQYGFDVSAPGVYNLLAKTKDLYAMRRPVHINVDTRVILDDAILQKPGSLSGTVHLEGKSDHRAAIILFMGTNLYSTPMDSTGAFSAPALAQGSYTLRILTAESGFAAVETTIAVMSGGSTVLPCIELRKRFIPAVDSLSVFYDPAMMRVTLKWPAIDTAKIKSYAIYCNRSTNIAPIATIDKSVSTRSFDLVTSPIDTFHYQISAVGNDGVEGPSTAGKLFNKSSAIALRKIIPNVPIEQQWDFQQLCFDQHDHIFIASDSKIIKLDSNGTFLGEFNFACDSGAVKGIVQYQQIQMDTAGNIYTLVYSDPSFLLLKFSNDLQIVRELTVDNIKNLNFLQYSFAVSATGAFMLQSSYHFEDIDTIGYGTRRRVYDPQFNLQTTDSAPGKQRIVQSVKSNDTTIGFVMNDFMGESKIRIIYYNGAFKEISSPVTLDFHDNFKELSSFVPPGLSPGWFYMGLKDLFAIHYGGKDDSSSLLLFINDRLQPVARVPFERFCCALFFDCKGNAYGIPETEKNTIIKYSMTKVLKDRAQ
jgi:hypothetical protein